MILNNKACVDRVLTQDGSGLHGHDDRIAVDSFDPFLGREGWGGSHRVRIEVVLVLLALT